MQLTVKGKQLDVGDSLRGHVEEHLNHITTKYFRDPLEATVIFSKEKNHLFKADISIHVGGGIVVQTHHEDSDPYPAFDVAAKAAGKRLSKYKEKLRDHRKTEPDALTAAYTTFASEEVEEAEGGTGGAIIAEMETQILTLAVADAVMRLELGSMPALLFHNPKHGGLNMVYRRKDGNIGWIDPAIVEKAAAAKKSAASAKPAAPAAKKKPAKPAPKKKVAANTAGKASKKKKRAR
jgi:ribosomal subunit interface protein